MTMLTKIEKAELVAKAMNEGLNNYGDRCDRIAYALWKHYDAQEDETHIYTASDLAFEFDERPNTFVDEDFMYENMTADEIAYEEYRCGKHSYEDYCAVCDEEECEPLPKIKEA